MFIPQRGSDYEKNCTGKYNNVVNHDNSFENDKSQISFLILTATGDDLRSAADGRGAETELV